MNATNGSFRFTVAWMALIDLLLMMNSAALLWYYAVENFADPTVLDGSAWNFNMLPFFCTLYVTILDD